MTKVTNGNRISTFYCSGCEAQLLEATVIQGRFYCDACTLGRMMEIKHYDPYTSTKGNDGNRA